MHHICNFVRLCFNNNKNTTLKKHKKIIKNKKHKKTCFLNFYKNIKNVFYIYGISREHGVVIIIVTFTDK